MVTVGLVDSFHFWLQLLTPSGCFSSTYRNSYRGPIFSLFFFPPRLLKTTTFQVFPLVPTCKPPFRQYHCITVSNVLFIPYDLTISNDHVSYFCNCWHNTCKTVKVALLILISKLLLIVLILGNFYWLTDITIKNLQICIIRNLSRFFTSRRISTLFWEIIEF